MRGRLIGMVVVAGLALALAAPTWAEQAEPYLRGPEGPYRGKVMDAETGHPLAEALVLAVWQKEDVQLDGFRQFVAARETLTDATGAFVIDGAAIEASPPLLALPPRFIIYADGYTPFPPSRRAPPGVPAATFRGPGGTVRLHRVRTEDERILAFNTFVALLSAFQIHDLDPPPPGTPRLMALHRAILREFERHGFYEKDGKLWHKDFGEVGEVHR